MEYVAKPKRFSMLLIIWRALIMFHHWTFRKALTHTHKHIVDIRFFMALSLSLHEMHCSAHFSFESHSVSVWIISTKCKRKCTMALHPFGICLLIEYWRFKEWVWNGMKHVAHWTAMHSTVSLASQGICNFDMNTMENSHSNILHSYFTCNKLTTHAIRLYMLPTKEDDSKAIDASNCTIQS